MPPLMNGREFGEVVSEPGFLPDHSIAAALEAGFLIERNTWDPARIRHASYMVRLGHRVEVERGNADRRKQRERVSLQLHSGGPPLELQPGDTALLFSMENLRLPDCVLGFTVARGLLVVETLVPENTYVDPGFSGPIYTTVTNLSGRVLKLEYGMPIARLFFYKLPSSVRTPYRTGPSIGVDQHLPSRPVVGLPTRTLARTAILTALVWPTLLQVASNWTWLQQQVGPIVLGVLTTLVAAALISGSQWLWTRFGDK